MSVFQSPISLDGGTVLSKRVSCQIHVQGCPFLARASRFYLELLTAIFSEQIWNLEIKSMVGYVAPP